MKVAWSATSISIHAAKDIAKRAGRYFVYKKRLWRCTNPNLDEALRQRLVRELMQARRHVNAAKSSGCDDDLKTARNAVNEAKTALGERGPTWWDDDSDYNQCLVTNTP